MKHLTVDDAVMSHEQPLQTLRTPLLPSTCAVRLTEVTVESAGVHLQRTTTAPAAACPRGAEPSSAVHSRYQRPLMDRPWGPLVVRSRLVGR